ncbi:MAG: ATP-binding protein [Kiloniellales bacterium]|nr:ATP-binding protein [Kiloniellales bacterium]MDJ0980141.1 ATP-binding protein [Kiloniellales bacterium]
MFAKLRLKDVRLAVLFVVVGVLAAVGLGRGEQFLIQQLLQSQADHQALFWGDYLNSHIDDVDALLNQGAVTARDEQVIAFITRSDQVQNFRMFDQDGLVALAARPEDLGLTFDADFFLRDVRRGQPVTILTDAVDASGRSRSMGRIYQPFMKNGIFRGAVEIEADFTEIRNGIKAFLDTAEKALLVGLVLITLILGFFVRQDIRERNTQIENLQRAHQSLAEAEAEVAQLNGQLERRVEQRTLELNAANDKLSQVNENMARLNQELEQRVEERTAQLSKVIDQVHAANDGMAKMNETLEQRIEERTAELQRANADILGLNQELERRVEQRTAELQAAQSELMRQERLAAIGHLTATVSHELRNPLGAIRTAIYLVRGRTEGQGLGVESALERVDRSVSRCDNIINELLDYTRATALKLENQAVDDWLQTFLGEQDLPPPISAKLLSGTGGLVAAFDPERLRRALSNLLNNACEAMVEAAENGASNGQPQLEITSRVAGEYFEIVVADNGPGIAPETLPQVFEPLFSTKSGAVGLGLPTVKQIMEQHGGDVEVTSTQDSGTQVRLWMPIKQVQEQAA